MTRSFNMSPTAICKNHAAPYERARSGIGYVPQGREIFPRLTVAENLEMGLATRPRGASLPERIFAMFPVLKQMLHRRGGDLSGGQQQQLAIARALAMTPFDGGFGDRDKRTLRARVGCSG